VEEYLTKRPMSIKSMLPSLCWSRRFLEKSSERRVCHREKRKGTREMGKKAKKCKAAGREVKT